MIQSSPDAIVFMLGSEDAKGRTWNMTTPDQFESKYGQFLADMAELPSKPKIFAVVPPPVLPCYDFSQDDNL